METALDHPGRPYRPGDVVTGKLVNVPKDAKFEFLQIALIGVAQNTVTRLSADGRSQVQVRYPVLLACEVQDAKKNQDGTWRFGIQVPTAVKDLPAFKHWYNQMVDSSPIPQADLVRMPFATKAGHPLPPSVLEFSNGPTRACVVDVLYSLVPMERTLNASNELECKRHKPSYFWVTANCPTDDAMASFTQRQSSTTAAFLLQSKKLVANDSQQKSGLLGKLKSSKPPWFNCQVTLSTPAGFKIGDPLPLRIDVASIDPPQTFLKASSCPEISLVDVKIELERFAVVRGDGIHKYSSIVSQCGLSDLPEPHIFRASPEGHYEGASFTISQTLSQGERVPDFQTYNVAISHLLRIRVQFTLLGEKRQVTAALPTRLFQKARISADATGSEQSEEDWGPCMPKTGHEGISGAHFAFEGLKTGANITLNLLSLAS